MSNRVLAEAAQSCPSQMQHVLHHAHQSFGNRGNFRGVDIGFRWKNGVPTDEVCVRIHVDRKLSLDNLMASQVLPEMIEGIGLDVIEASYQPSLEPGTARSAAARQPYAMGGLSCGRHGEGSGTIGLVVIDTKTGKPGILSNWHVLAGPRARRNDPVTQPGGSDGGFDPRDRIARLTRWLLDRSGDAAFAELLPDQPWLPLQFGSFSTVAGTRCARLGEVLTKSARSGAAQQARVDGQGVYRVPYEIRPGVFEYRDIEGFKLVSVDTTSAQDGSISVAGDSGAAWISAATGDAVGLQFGAHSCPEQGLASRPAEAIACDLPRVFQRLDLRLADFHDLMEQNNKEPILTAYQQRQAHFSTMAEAPDTDWPHPLNWPNNGGHATDHLADLTDRPARNRRDPQMGEILPLVRFSPNGQFCQQDRGHPAHRFSIPQDIWLLRLHPALLDYDANFQGVFLEEPVAQRISAADSKSIYAFFAHLINGSRHFDSIGLKQMQASDFEGAVTYVQVCQRILAMLENS